MFKIIISVILMLLPLSALASDQEFLGQPNTTLKETQLHGHDAEKSNQVSSGTWKEALEESGLSVEAVYTGEIFKNFDPGLVKGTTETIYLDNLDLTLTLDTEKANLWSGGTLFVYGLYNSGRNPSEEVVGDLQTASNIEAPDNALVYEAWYEQQFSESFSLLFGFHDLNSEFYVSEYSGLFLNSSPGIGAEISSNVPLSIFAQTGLALRLKYYVADSWYLQSAIYDGDPATRELNDSEGKMYISEGGLIREGGTYKLGVWNHTAIKSFGGEDFNNDSGHYGIVDQKLIRFGKHGEVAAFLRWGAAPKDRNEVTGHEEIGLHIHGIFQSRSEDDLGIALIQAHTAAGTEIVNEFTYRLVVTPWLSFQPSFQIIQNPGGDSANSTIKVGLLRFEISA